MSSRRAGWRLTGYVAPYWEVLAFALTTGVVMAATAPLLAALARPALDGAIGAKDQDMLQLVMMGVIALFMVRGLAGYGAACSTSWLISKVTRDLRIAIFDKCLDLPARYFATHPVGDLVFLLVSGTARAVRAFITLIIGMVKDVLTILGLLGWAFYLNWRLSAIALSIGAFIVLMARPLLIRLEKAGIELAPEVGPKMGPELGTELERAMERIASILRESIENRAALKLYGGWCYESHRAREQADEIHRLLAKRANIASLSIPLRQLAIALAIAVLIYLTARQTSTAPVTFGSQASVAIALAMLYAPVMRLAALNKSAEQELMQAQSIFSLLDEQVESDSGSTTVVRVRGELRFEHVSFSVPARGCRGRDTGQTPEPDVHEADTTYAALREIDLTVDPGEMVALVGFQENSIAALAELVPLFFHPSSGKILLDGQNVEDIHLASLRANIALVSANAMLFDDTLAANIAFGDMSDATEARIMAAAYAAHVSGFARELSEGMQTAVNATGTPHSSSARLTSGQRFCVAAARALLKDSPVLIVDETGEALDVESTPFAEAALEAAARGRTTLVVARRLSTVEKADRVVLLDKGCIIATGPHTELLAGNLLYARLARTFI